VSELGSGSISACVVVRNEEAVIERCLNSLDGVVDEIVLVHSGPCEDRTLEIARRHGCRIFEAEDGGHGEHNTPFAYQRARGEWLLNLDADEFLSPELRARLREMTREPEIDGYAFMWPIWSGQRYLTAAGPYKRVLFRRARTRMVGLIHSPERIDGRVCEVPLLLEHRHPEHPYAMRTIATKWRQQARIQAREYTRDLSDVPRFNYPGELRWSRRRRIANLLSPLLVLPAALHTFVYVLRTERNHLRPLENLRAAMISAVYRAMVTAYVARFVYLRRSAPTK
jgi:glycosyltransferase involved in cell wall biosynthesis